MCCINHVWKYFLSGNIEQVYISNIKKYQTQLFSLFYRTTYRNRKRDKLTKQHVIRLKNLAWGLSRPSPKTICYTPLVWCRICALNLAFPSANTFFQYTLCAMVRDVLRSVGFNTWNKTWGWQVEKSHEIIDMVIICKVFKLWAMNE
jgi:uncharacterized membrane protein